MGCGTVSWCLAPGVRSRRGATESTRHARVSTMSRPAIRWGCVTHNDATHNRGSLSTRPLPSPGDGPLSAALTSAWRQSLASRWVPRTPQAWRCGSCSSGASSARPGAWRGPAMAWSGGRGVGRPVPASCGGALRGDDATRCSVPCGAHAARASGAALGAPKRWAGQGTRCVVLACWARGVALVRGAAARSRAAGEDTTRPRGALPSGHTARG
jgi:hypothetical protein